MPTPQEPEVIQVPNVLQEPAASAPGGNRAASKYNSSVTLRPHFIAALATALTLLAPALTLAQNNLFKPLEVSEKLKPLDEKIRVQWVLMSAEQDRVWKQNGGPTREYYEITDRLSPSHVYGKQAVQFATEHRGTDEALAALAFVVEVDEGLDFALSDATWEELLTHYSERDELSWICGRCVNSFGHDSNVRHLTSVLERSKNQRVRAAACYAVTQLYDLSAQLRPNLKDVRARFERDGLLSALPKMISLEAHSQTELELERTKYLRLVKQKFSNEHSWVAERTFGRLDYQFHEAPDGPTFGEVAAQLEDQIAHFRAGAEAPDFSAEDVDGRAFRLADRRGKPTLILFSFKGCGPCETFYPVLRKLQEDYSDIGFQAIGVMADEKPDTVREAIAAGEIAWPCIWDSRSGPIIARYRVETYPELYLLDREGKIVGRSTDDVVLRRQLDALRANP